MKTRKIIIELEIENDENEFSTDDLEQYFINTFENDDPIIKINSIKVNIQ